MSRRPPAGFTLIELLVVMVLLGLLAGLAAPSLRATVQRIRLRSALDGVSGTIYHARVLAARSGSRVQIRFEVGDDGCVERYGMLLPGSTRLQGTVDLSSEVPELCLVVSGSPVLSIDSRGMPTGAARKIRARLDGEADSLVVSMIGRIYRFSF